MAGAGAGESSERDCAKARDDARTQSSAKHQLGRRRVERARRTLMGTSKVKRNWRTTRAARVGARAKRAPAHPPQRRPFPVPVTNPQVAILKALRMCPGTHCPLAWPARPTLRPVLPDRAPALGLLVETAEVVPDRRPLQLAEIADTLGLSHRAVRTARARLIALGSRPSGLRT